VLLAVLQTGVRPEKQQPASSDHRLEGVAAHHAWLAGRLSILPAQLHEWMAELSTVTGQSPSLIRA